MRNSHTEGLHYLNPIDTSACIMLSLYYLSKNPADIEVYVSTDKLTKLELANNSTLSQPDLNQIETIFQGVNFLLKKSSQIKWT